MRFIMYNNKIEAPRKTYNTDAGYDCFLPHDIHIPAHNVKIINLGFGVKLKKNECAIVTVRSSISKLNLIANNAPIDCGYTGECHLILHNLSDYGVKLLENQRVCQIVIFKIPRRFGLNKRKNNNFGSSGK